MEAIKKLDIQLAATIMLAILSCIVVFHLLVLSGAIPYSVVWGGRLESPSQMHLFEAVSITINLAVITIVCIRAGRTKPFISERAVKKLIKMSLVMKSRNYFLN